MVSKRNTIIRSNRNYLLENMKPTDILIDKMVKVDCLTKEKSDFIARLQHNTVKNEELLNIARSLSFKKHFAFIESLRFCGQLGVANVIEKGGVVVMAKIIHTSLSDSTEFTERVNARISELNEKHSEDLNELLVLNKKETLEMLEVKPLERRKQNQSSMIYLRCKSQSALRKLQKLLESDELLNRFDFLISCLSSMNESSLYNLSGRFRYQYKTEPPQFLKRLTIDDTQFKKEVAVRRMSLLRSGNLDLPHSIMALTSLDDKIYALLGHLVSIHEDNPPFACVSKIFFPRRELQTTFWSPIVNRRYFMVACDETKCIYIANDNDSRLWKLTTPDFELKLWLPDIGNPFSLYVARNGNVVLLKEEDDQQNRICMEVYNKDASLVHEFSLPLPNAGRGLDPGWAMEISPGLLAFHPAGSILIQTVDFRTVIGDPDISWFTRRFTEWRNGNISRLTSYCEGQFLMLLSGQLAVLDSLLNVHIVPTSATIDAKQLHFKKDKRQLMFWSPGRDRVQIYILAYKAEDMFADNP